MLNVIALALLRLCLRDFRGLSSCDLRRQERTKERETNEQDSCLFQSAPRPPISMLVGDFQANGGGVLTELISQVRQSISGATLEKVVWGKERLRERQIG